MKVFVFLFGARIRGPAVVLVMALALAAPYAAAAAEFPKFKWLPFPGDNGVMHLLDTWVPNSPQTQGWVGTMTFFPPNDLGFGYIRYKWNEPDSYYRVVEENKWYFVVLVQSFNESARKSPLEYRFYYFQTEGGDYMSKFSVNYGYCGFHFLTQEHFAMPQSELVAFWNAFAHCNPMARADPTNGHKLPLREMDYWYNHWSRANMWRASEVPVLPTR